MVQKNPYIGPRTFQRDEGHLFFGREREARDLIALVASERLVVFYAQSGAGKSSIVNTRLIPNLEAKEYEVLPVGRVSGDLIAGEGVDNIYIHNLIHSFEQHDTDPKTFASLTLSDFLAHLNYDDQGFFYDPTPVEVDPASDQTEVARRALIIDQFEELFSTYPESWEKREKFFEQLAKAMADDPQLWVVLVMREDYIAALDPYAHIVSNGLRVRYYMQRLGREAALKAVKSPVEEIRPYAEGVAEKLIDDLCSIKVQKPDGTLDIQPGQYAEPVQMQVVCYGLWDNLPAEGTQITEKDLQDVGDVNQSLGKYYDRRVGEVAKAKNVRERLIREWFEKKLITVGGIRNMVLQERYTKPGELDDKVIQALQSDLVRAEKRGGATWYELTHDRLVEPILERNKTWFTEHLSPLQRQAALWKDQNRGETWLLQDHALIEVEVWAGTHKDELTDVEKDFLEACRVKQAEQKEKQSREAERRELESTKKLMDVQARSARIARWFSLVAGILLIVALFATVRAIISSNEANQKSTELTGANDKISTAQALAEEQKDIARSSELSTIGLVLSDNQLDLAMLLGIEADSIASNEKSLSALTTLSQKSSSYLGTIKGQEEILDIQFSPDGKIFASRDINGITLWDARTLKPLTDTPLNEHYAGVTALAANSDGTIIASGGTDGTIILWDASEHKMLSEPFPAESDSGSIVTLAFSPDGNTLASAGINRFVFTLWDITNPETPKLIGESPLKHQGGILSMAFSPDGEILATGSYDRSIILWDITDHKNPKDNPPIAEHTDWVNKLTFLHENGDVLVSASDDSRVILWNVKDPKTSKKIVELLNDNYTYVRGLAISPDNQTLASGNVEGSIILWDISDTNKQVKITTLNQNNEGAISSLLAFVDNKTLASTSYEGNMVIWSKNANSWERVSNFVKGGTGTANAMIFLPDQNTAITGSSDSTISFWDTSDSRRPVKTGVLIQESLTLPTYMQFSPDGSLLASYGVDGSILFDTKSQSLIGPGSIVGTNPDGTLLAYTTLDRTSGETSIHIRDTQTFEDIVEPFPGQNPAFSSNGKWLVFQKNQQGGNTLHIWDIVKKESVSPGIGDFLSFSPDGDILVYQTTTQGINKIHLWDIFKRNFIVKDIDGFSPHISSNGKTLLYQNPDAIEPKISLYNIASETLQNNTIPGSIVATSQNNKVLVFTTYNPESGITFINAVDMDSNKSIIQPIENGNFQTISRDGKILIYLDTENKINVYDVQNDRTIAEKIEGSFIRLTENGEVLIYQSADGKLNLLDMTGQNGATILNGTYITGTQGDLDLIVFENNSNTIRLWDIAKNKNIGLPINESYGSFFAINPNGEILVTKNEKNEVVFWDMTRTWSLGEPIGEIINNESNITLNSDGTTIAQIGNQGIVLQDVDNGQQLGGPFNDHFESTFPGAYSSFSPDGRLLAIGNYSAPTTTKLWDLNTLKQIDKEFPGDWPIFSPDGRFLAIGDNNATTVWNLNTEELVIRFEYGSIPSFSSDGKVLAIGDRTSSITKLWDTNTFEQIGGDFPGIWPIFSPDSKLLAIGDYNIPATTVWEWGTRQPKGDKFPGYIASFSSDSKLLAVGDPGASTIRVWDLDAPEQVRNEFPGTWPAFNPERGSWLLAIGNSDTPSTILRDLKTLEQIDYDFPDYIPSFSSDGKLFASGSESSRKTAVWDVKNLKQPNQLQNKTVIPPTRLALSLDGKYLASLASDGIVLRNLDTDIVLRLDNGDYNSQISIYGMSFYEDNKRFAAVGDDGSLITWDVETGKPTIPKESDPAFGKFTGFSMFSPNGNYLVYNESNSLRVWDVVNNEPYHDSASIDIQNIDNVRISFNPDGDVMAFAEGEKVQLYYFPELTARGDELSTGTAVNGLGLVMDDNIKVKYLFVLDQSGNTQIWDWGTQTKVGDPIPGNLQFVGSSTQEHTVFYIDSSGRLIKYKWDLDHNALQNLLCERVRRNFTRSEWAQYIDEPYPAKPEDATCPQWALEPEVTTETP